MTIHNMEMQTAEIRSKPYVLHSIQSLQQLAKLDLQQVASDGDKTKSWQAYEGKQI